MTKVKGTTGRAEHFRHLPGQEVLCLPDNSLHKMAQAVIVQAFLTAIETETPYNCILENYCQICHNQQSVDLAQIGSGIAAECSIIEGTRSDLVVFNPDGNPRVIIEIVVTHDLSVATERKYVEAQIPVIRLTELSFEKVESLQSEIRVVSWLNIDKSRECSSCKAKREEAKALVNIQLRRPAQRPVDITHVGLDANLNKAIRKIPLRRETRERLNRQAYQLAKLGFCQSTSRPTLFTLNAGGRQVYADLDSTTVLKAWECKGPALYSFNGPGCRECVLEEVQRQLDKYGVIWRRHFMDYDGHDHELG